MSQADFYKIIGCNKYQYIMRKYQARQRIQLESTLQSSTQKSTQNSYISFKSPATFNNKQAQIGSSSKTGRCLQIVSKPVNHSRNRITKKAENPEQKGPLKIIEGLCSCVQRQDQDKLLRVKQLKSTRQDLTTLLNQTFDEKEEDKSITPINSLMNLLKY